MLLLLQGAGWGAHLNVKAFCFSAEQVPNQSFIGETPLNCPSPLTSKGGLLRTGREFGVGGPLLLPASMPGIEVLPVVRPSDSDPRCWKPMVLHRPANGRLMLQQCPAVGVFCKLSMSLPRHSRDPVICTYPSAWLSWRCGCIPLGQALCG